MDYLNTTNLALTELSAAVIFFNIFLSFGLSLLIAIIYKKTHRGLSYSRSYVESLVMMSVLAAIAMMILGNNVVRALGILGVFTLIRFRTIIKDTKDATYLFFSLAVGMGVGTANYIVSILGTGALLVIIYFLDKYNFGSVTQDGFLLTFIADKNFSSRFYEELFDKYLGSYKLLQHKTNSDGDGEFYFSVAFKDKVRPEDLVRDLNENHSIKLTDLIVGKDAIEY